MVDVALVTTERRIIFTDIPQHALEQIRQTMKGAGPGVVAQFDLNSKVVLVHPLSILIRYGVGATWNS